MKNYIFFLIILSFYHSTNGQQHQRPAQEQLVGEAFEQLPLIRAELAKPVGPNNQQQPPAPVPNQHTIDGYKQRLQGPAFGRLSSSIIAGDRLHVQHTAQEAIAQISLVTAAAQEAALQERFVQKNSSLAKVRSHRQEDEDTLDTLHEIKQLQEQQKQRALIFEKACKDLHFLAEVKALDEKLSQLASHLSRLDLELSGEIIAAQKILSELKHS